MNTTVYTVPQLAGILGITTAQVFNELQSFPYQGKLASGIRFTEADVAEIRAIRAAGPDEQLERYRLLVAKRDQVRVLDEQDAAEDDVAA